MTDPIPPTEPDWTEQCTVRKLAGSNYMLRASDEPDSPWKLVTGKTYEAWEDVPACVTVTFEDGTVRYFLNFDEEVEIGLPPPGSNRST
jgi:hypothetical protein